MEATAVSVGKVVLDGALGYAKSKATEEIVLQLGVERDVKFIRDELQMMQSFLMMADEEQSQNKVLMTWAKQIGVLAYKVEDSLMDFGLHSEKKPFLGCIPCNCNPGDRRRIAKELKQLRAEVEDVSNRNLRYRLIKESSSSKPTTAEEQASIATAAMFGINEARLNTLEQEKSSEVDLHQLITSNDEDLRVILVWGPSGDLGNTSAIQEVYDDTKVLERFGFRAWIRLMHPFNPQEFLRSLVRQFYENSHDVVGKAEQDTNNKSRRAAVEDKLKDMHASCSVKPTSDSNKVTTTEKNTGMLTTEIQEGSQEPNAGEEKVHNSTTSKKFDRCRTLALTDEVLCGREKEKSDIIKLVGQPVNNQDCKVVSVWGMGGLGKTTLVRSIYRSQQLGGWKRAWTTALRPFNPEVLHRDLALQLQKSIQEAHAGSGGTEGQNKSIPEMNLQELKDELARLLKTKRCLVVVDDILSTFEWNLVKLCLHDAGMIIVTTREKNIAIHCSKEDKNMYQLKGLNYDAALDLFKKKVFRDNIEEIDLGPAMMEQARLTLQKCAGLPLAISTIGGFLATKPKTAIEWRKMNERIGTELEMNPELKTIKTILMRSYDCLPYYLKSAFLYLSVFPEDHKIRWGRLMRRWIAEGYSRDIHGMTAVELCQRYFDELLDRSMILPGEGTNTVRKSVLASFMT